MGQDCFQKRLEIGRWCRKAGEPKGCQVFFGQLGKQAVLGCLIGVRSRWVQRRQFLNCVDRVDQILQGDCGLGRGRIGQRVVQKRGCRLAIRRGGAALGHCGCVLDAKRGRIQQIGTVLRITGIPELELDRALGQLIAHGSGGRLWGRRGLDLIDQRGDRGRGATRVALIQTRKHGQHLPVTLSLGDIAIGIIETGIENCHGGNGIDVGQTKELGNLCGAGADRSRRHTARRDGAIRVHTGQLRGNRGYRVDIEGHQGGVVCLRHARAHAHHHGTHVGRQTRDLVAVVSIGIRIAQHGDDRREGARKGRGKTAIVVDRHPRNNQVPGRVKEIHRELVTRQHRPGREGATHDRNCRRGGQGIAGGVQ